MLSVLTCNAQMHLGPSEEDYAEKVFALQDSMRIEDSTRTAKLLAYEDSIQEKHDWKAKRYEVARLNSQSITNTKNIILVSVIVFGSVGLVYFFLSRERLKTRDQLFEISKEITGLEEKLNSKNLSEAMMKLDLQTKSVELTTLNLNLDERDELIENIRTEFALLKKKADSTLHGKLTKFMFRINININSAKHWDVFRIYFEKIHAGFFPAVLAKYPDLNRTDLRLCALARLGFNSREIAEVLEISWQSAKVAKHRLRKKLGLPTKQKLTDFFTELHPESAINPDLSDLKFLARSLAKKEEDEDDF